MDSDSRTQSEPQVRSSELVVLLVRWDKDVALWERVADKEGGALGERCRARAHEIANCRRELQEVINAGQHNDQAQ